MSIISRENEDTLNKFVETLRQTFEPNRDAIREALKTLVLFRPEATPAQFTSSLEGVHPHYRGAALKKREIRAELKKDAKAPFFTEAYLYNLLGKEDARSLLSRINALCRVLGVDYYNLFRE